MSSITEKKDADCEVPQTWYQKNKARAKENNRRNYEKNKEKVNARAKEWRINNIEKARASVRKYSLSDKYKAMRNKMGVEARKIINRVGALKWSRANPEKHREITRLWRIENPAKVRHSKLIRYAREKGAEGKYTLYQWQAVVNYYCPNGKCLACGKLSKMTRDHVIPLVKGGSNYITNIQPLCRICNSSKRDKTIDYRPDEGEYTRSL